MAKELRRVVVESAKIRSVKADLVGGVVRISFEMPLLAALPIREDLSWMAFAELPCEIEITQLQSELDLKYEQSLPGKILDQVAEEINKDPAMHATVTHGNINLATGEIDDEDS